MGSTREAWRNDSVAAGTKCLSQKSAFRNQVGYLYRSSDIHVTLLLRVVCSILNCLSTINDSVLLACPLSEKQLILHVILLIKNVNYLFANNMYIHLFIRTMLKYNQYLYNIFRQSSDILIANNSNPSRSYTLLYLAHCQSTYSQQLLLGVVVYKAQG